MAYASRFYASLSPLGVLSQWIPPPTKFSVDDIPDLTGQVILVTGGNTGIGYATCLALLNHGAKVYLASRSEQKGRGAIERLKAETGREAVLLKLDLSDLASVKSAAEEFLRHEDHMDVLFENAAVAPFDLALNAAGLDLSFATNVLGHAYLDRLLLPALTNTLKLTGHKARIVITSSFGANDAPRPTGLKWSTLNVDESSRKERAKMGAFAFYEQSKMGNLLHAQWLHHHFGDKLVVTSLHPGGVNSEAFRDVPPIAGWVIKNIVSHLFMDCDTGSLTQLYAGTSPEAVDAGGKYFVPIARDGTSILDKRALVEETQEKLAEWVDEQIRRQSKETG